MKLVTILGARPQFIKAWPLSRALRERGIYEYVVHTGQHYDQKMSGVFFSELDIAPPAVNLGVGSGSHARQTAAMLVGIETVLEAQRPDWLLVYGDTNSTVAGALAAVKLHIPIAHVEAGLRSFNRRMPEEHNRVLTDHASDLLLCPTAAAVANLQREGLNHGVHLVGDVMLDALFTVFDRVTSLSPPAGFDLPDRSYFLATIHRAENTDNPTRLREIFAALSALPLPVFVPLHPRTRKTLGDSGLTFDPDRIRLVEPLGYFDMVKVLSRSRAVLTDSGGLQKEAIWLGLPCITLRDETEWVETLEDGYNRISGADRDKIVGMCETLPSPRAPQREGAGAAARAAALLAGAPLVR